MFVLTIGLDQYSLPEFNNINTSCGDWKTHVLVWESVVNRGWYFNSPNISQEFGVCFSQCTMWCWPTSKQNSLVEIPDGLSIWGPCVRYGVSAFFGWYNFLQFGDYRLTFWAWFSALHQIGGMSQIWGSSAIYLPWRRDHATWWCGDRWYFSWNRCFFNYTPKVQLDSP